MKRKNVVVVVVVLELSHAVSVDVKHHDKKDCRGCGPVPKPYDFCGHKAPRKQRMS